MIIRNHTTKISGSLMGLPDFLPSTENNWGNIASSYRTDFEHRTYREVA